MGMSTDCLKVLLNSSLPLEYRQDHKDFFRDVEEKIACCSSVGEVWIHCNQFWNYLNYAQLESFVTGLDDTSLNRYMNNYVILLRKFCEKTLVKDFATHCPVCNFSTQHPGVVKEDLKHFVVHFKLDFQKCTIADVNQVAHDIMLRFHLPNFTMNLKSLSPGSLVITWSLPTALASHVKKNLANTDMTFMRVHDILTISIDGQVCTYSAIEHYSTEIKNTYSKKKNEKKHSPFKMVRVEKERSNGSNFDKFTRSTLRGDQDDVVNTKYPIEESEVGFSWGSQPRLVLIEGAPGVGKTTFSEQLCYKWSQGQRLSHHRLLVLLPLRDQTVRAAKNVRDLFQHPSPQLQQDVAEEVERSGGEGMALWLEAWDELEEDMRTKSSLFLDLVHSRLLPKATVFITSRPWATKDIRDNTSLRVDQHIEVVSTPNRQLSRVLDSVVQSNVRDIFLNYIESNPIIKAAMHTPVTADIVADVFQWSQDTEFPPPTTITQLYTAFTCKLLMQHLSSHRAEDAHTQKIRSLEELPADVEKQLLNLCELSWQGLVRQQLAFNSVAVGGETLGLMHEVRELYGGEDSQPSYHFIHLTLQEFLSAYHLTQLHPEKQAQLIQQNAKNGHLSVALKFYFGLTSPNASMSSLSSLIKWCTRVIMSALLQQQSLKPDELQDRLPHYVPTRLKDYLSHCFTAHYLLLEYITSQHESKSASVFHWLFEAGEVRKVIVSEMAVWVRASYDWIPLDYYVCGYSISHSNFKWDLYFSNTSMGDEGMEYLCMGLSSNPANSWRGEIISADFQCNGLTVEGMKWLANVPPPTLKQIKTLDLQNNKFNRNALVVLSYALTHLTVLEKLYLSNNDIGDGGAEEILRALHQCKTPLKILNLSYTGIGDNDIPYIAKLLENGILHELQISECNVTTIGAVQLATALTYNTSLRALWMDNRIGVEGAKATAKMLQLNKTLKRLDLDGDESLEEEGVEVLITSLQENTTLNSYLPRKYQRPSDPRVKWF